MNNDFERACLLAAAFRGDSVRQGQAYLLMIGLSGKEFSGADLPKEIVGDSIHLSGIICGTLQKIGLAEYVSRIVSPHPEAHRRKINSYRIPANKISTAKTWLNINGFSLPQSEEQQSLIPCDAFWASRPDLA